MACEWLDSRRHVVLMVRMFNTMPPAGFARHRQPKSSRARMEPTVSEQPKKPLYLIDRVRVKSDATSSRGEF